MKNIALFLFLLLLAGACTKEGVTDLRPATVEVSESQALEELSLLNDYLLNFTRSLDLGDLQHLRSSFDREPYRQKVTRFPAIDHITRRQARVARQLQALSDPSQVAVEVVLGQPSGAEKSFHENWLPFQRNCRYEVQVKQQQLLLQYFDCLSGASSEVEERSCLMTYLKRNAGLQLDTYVCTHGTTVTK